jgi:ABC-2 type transport system permease protein
MTKDIIVNFPIQIDFKEINDAPDIKSFNKKHLPVAVLLEGRFPSAWKGRIVNKMLPPGAKFIEKSKPTKMIVVSDGDIIKNVVKSNGEVFPLDFDKYSLYSYKGNKQFIINAVNYLCDDQGLMSIRSRQFKLRLLDKKAVVKEKTMWQILNLILPDLLILIIGLIFVIIRTRKYGKTK